MKPIKIHYFFRPPILMILGILVGVALSIFLLSAGVAGKSEALICLGGLPLLCIAVGVCFYSIYGIKITKKKVRICYYDIYETFRYEDINYIKLGFNDHAIWGEVKPFRQKPVDFVMVDFYSPLYCSFPLLVTTKVKITKRKADKIVKDLSRCEKVRLENQFEE